MIVDKYSTDGNKIGQIELLDKVFASEVNDVLVYEFIKALNANLRQGTHKTKARSDVRGGGAKPWKQKGTGRARQGTRRAPQWRGGGVVFGPQPRSYRIDIPKRQKRIAMASILTIKARENQIKVVSDFEVSSGKTKDMASILKKLNIESGVLIYHKDDVSTKRSIRNIESVLYNNVNRLSGREIFYSKAVLFTESAVNAINEKFSKGE